jgi:hypothetical protein
MNTDESLIGPMTAIKRLVGRKKAEMKQRILTFSTAALCACVFLVSNMLQAQTPEEKLQSLSQILGLNEQQKSQLLPILKAEAPKLQALKSDPSKRDKRKEMKAIHDQADPQIKAILSPTQYQQWKELRKQEIDKAKSGG